MTDENILIIDLEWSTGNMKLIASLFFPTNQKRAKQLFELMKISKCSITFKELEEYLYSQLKFKDIEKQATQKLYFDEMQKAADIREENQRLFHSDGRLVTEKEHFLNDTEYKKAKSEANKYLKDYKSLNSKSKKILGNIKTLQPYLEG